MADSLFSWTTLMTLSGAAMITFLIVLYTGRIMIASGGNGERIYMQLYAHL